MVGWAWLMWFLIFWSRFSILILLRFSVLKRFLSLLAPSWLRSYILQILLLLFVYLMWTNSAPGSFHFGVSLISVFFMSWRFWFSGVLIVRGRLGAQTIVTLFTTRFNLFILLLRPVTLTLRILINVTLGHTAILLIGGLPLILLFLVEGFVYLVQSFVFIVLVKEYLPYW